ncbi:ribosome recycling factor [uncultured Ezakiella sp.]|uniref:ribosome recycling factor n=1 Tax=uncultured Ezakiella sp. TaxID=1637529 RepID=UPI0025F4B901|nr:ribosome recycling factor [uncultured Ezakiella sp.]
MNEIFKDAEDRMSKSVSVYKDDLAAIRAGRANPALLDRIDVDYYGVMTPIKQLSNISAPEPRLIVIQPFDANVIPEIEKAILASDLGLNPANDGKVVRLAIPQLTEERRKDLTKLVGKSGEEAKVNIRNIRRDLIDGIKKLEKDKEITEDDRKRSETEAQELTDKFIESIDKLTKEKEAELMEI